MSPRSMVLLFSCAFLISFSGVAAARDGDGLIDYWGESTWLGSPPGISTDLSAGLFNPAAYPVAKNPGLYFGWRNNRALQIHRGGRTFLGESNDLAGIVSLGTLSFSYQRFDPKEDYRAGVPTVGPGNLDGATGEYALTVGEGDRSKGFGISYSWVGGNRELLPRHKRLSSGVIGRGRRISSGLVGNWDLENGDLQVQADLGLRPMGPRWTVFGELESGTGTSLRGGYGLEAYVFRGLRASARYRDGGNYSIALAVSFGGDLRFAAATHANTDRHTQETYSVQIGGHSEPSLPWLSAPAGSAGGVSRMELKGPMPYRRYRLFDQRRTLISALGQIAAAAQSPRIRTLVLNLSGMKVTREMLWELREQLEGFRSQGKKVVIYCDRLGLSGYMLASVADQLWIDPQGNLDLRGISWGKTYYRRALDKLGLGVDEWRFFTYKSAFEVLSRTGQSEADREQRQLLIDDYYEEARAKIIAARGMTPGDFDKIVDTRGYVLPEEARELGLVDRIGGFDQAMEAAKKLETGGSGSMAGRTVPKGAAAAAAGSPSVDLSGVLGDPVWDGQRWGEPDEIAVLYAIGECAMDSGIRGRRLIKEIEKARKNPRVKAIVLRVDSPGGDPLPSDLVARQLLKTMKVKPVIISQGNVAASGGYWISMYSNALLASPMTLTGSIGVIGGWIYDKGFSDKIGFDYSEVQRGKHADMGGGIRLPFLNVTLPERPLDDQEHARMEKIIQGMYADFVSQVAKGRKMSEAAVDSIGQGRVWSGTRGKENGLVDELGGLWRAIQLAKEKAKIPPERGVRLVQGPSLGWFNPAILQLSLTPSLQAGSTLDPLSGEARPEPGVWMGLSDEEFRYLHAVFGNPGRPILRTGPIEIHDGSSLP